MSFENRNREADLDILADEFCENLTRGDCEYGGWGHDDKRPYGNSQVAYDIIDIIGIKCDDVSDELKEYANDLYSDLGSHIARRWIERKPKS